MAKKNQFKISKSNLILILSMLLGIASACMIFLNAFTLTYTVEGGWGEVIGALGGNPTTTENYTGLQAAFGFNEEIESTSYLREHLAPNFMVIIGFLLPIICVCASFIFSEVDKLTKIVGVVYIASSICIFLSILTMPNTILMYEKGSYELKMGVGVILSGIFSALSGLVLIGRKTFLKFLN